jgi:putative ATPase
MSYQKTLFEEASQEGPLAHRMRPKTFEQIFGQKHFLNENFIKVIDTDKWTGFVFWGPPGTGKTTLANTIANKTKRIFESHSAVISGVKELRETLENSKKDIQFGKPARILFVDEVHRLNKAQQDILLPYIEEGSIRFIGATTENPSFEINNAIASRCLIFHFLPLEKSELIELLKKSATKNFEVETFEKIAESSNGDARRALNILEHMELSGSSFEELASSQNLYYDKKSENHYDTISAFIKSVRGSDPDAALYYLARMLEGGEDLLFIARRLIILASEDIGNANPMALVLANNAFEAVHKIGMPEARIILGQAVTYLACCEKSNRSYLAIDEAIDCVRKTGNLEIPMHIRNAPTKLMKDWGYGKDYQYAHNDPRGWVEDNYLPEKIKNRTFYKPSEHGQEKKLLEFLKQRKHK